ncbi:sugar phosphate isomerase/epimerase [Cohnella endophytica]|uniref:Sugar phosphate isomerase/epimerase n=1 Tax=Cohnella endophytica TaxID=2419778 RepID=A0A494XDI9_9BACL|nr:TIM barrel protein [Cohnella endophytica]RKP48857.1 sugar phosphate isomerase/epimerase [Cohnella endophytica]
MSYLSFSTWSLHRILGPLRWTAWDSEKSAHQTHIQDQPQLHTLLELPAEAANRGYKAIEVCHFHFPSVDSVYLLELKKAFADAGVAFDTLLLDYGDLTSTDEARVEADLDLMRHWIDVASQSGAKQIRIVAGEAPATDERAILRSAASLSELVEYAAPLGVRVITENFKALTSTGASCMKLLEASAEASGAGAGAQGTLRMITDFGNFKGPEKYEEIAMTTPHSVSVHVKPIYDEEGIPDERELARCLEAVRDVGYDGAYVLIYDGPGDMWAGLERVKAIVEREL